jgi:hypothetical protein
MPKSKTRGSLKEHRKRVEHRNNTIRGLKRKAQAEYQEMFEKTMESLKAQYMSENGETVELDANFIGGVNEVDVNDVEIITPEVSDEN